MNYSFNFCKFIKLYKNAETIQLSLAERLWRLIIEIPADLAELIEIETVSLKELLISDNQRFVKLVTNATLMQAK